MKIIFLIQHELKQKSREFPNECSKLLVIASNLAPFHFYDFLLFIQSQLDLQSSRRSLPTFQRTC